MIQTYVNALSDVFCKNANPVIAEGQEWYMKHQFKFFGIKTPMRRKLQKPFLTPRYLPDRTDMYEIIHRVWELPQREFQYFGQELVLKYSKHFIEEDIDLFRYMVSHKSWWDTVDFIATKIIGNYFIKFPERRNTEIEDWIKSGHLWLQRSTILFQLKYKEALDREFLSYVIRALKDTDEFFLNKAIGWILREYSKTNAHWVKDFVSTTRLHNLSRREALRLM